MKLTFVLLASSALTSAQDPLKINEPVARELKAGISHRYQIQLNAGDLAAGSIWQQGKADLAILLPDGSKLRRFLATANDGKRPFAFIAETAGTYRLELTDPGIKPVTYELELKEVVSANGRSKITLPPEGFTAAKIAALRQQIASGDRSTVAFWKEIAAEGTPLIEPIKGDRAHQLVTFLWRGGRDTRNVLVIGSYKVGGGAVLENLMYRVAETDVWYLTVKLPRGARFTYVLSPNDPLEFEGPTPVERLAAMQADPLNPHRWACPPEASLFECQSMVELPGAVPQPWIVKSLAVPSGALEKEKIKSEILKNQREVSVYLPHGYSNTGAPNALLLVFDEEQYLDLVPTPVILDNLIAASRIPPAVAVLIASASPELRNRELAPNPEFAEFLAKELSPWVRSHYNVTSDPRLTVVAGSSRGGLFATYAALRHPEVFGNVLCQSGSFWWAPDHAVAEDDTTTETGWLAKQFINSPKLPLKFYMDAGTFEYDTWGGGGGILEPSRHMRDVLLAKGYAVHYQQFVGGHDYLSWRGTFADGLLALIGKEPPSKP